MGKNWIKEEWEKHKKGRKEKTLPKKQKISVDNELIREICKKFPADAKHFRRWVKDKIKYYGEHPFKNRTKCVLYDRTKQSVIFTNPNIKEKKPEPKKGEEKEVLEEFKKSISFYTSKRDLARRFYRIQPYFYDKARNWWLWNKVYLKWERIDDVDILNSLEEEAVVNTINSKEKNEILESLKQEGRKKVPRPVKPTWIQFNQMVVDILTGEQFNAEPKWFVTNPVPWNLNAEGFESTPTIDRIFGEWVGGDYVKTLYEIIAYCLLPDYPLHRIFWLYGSGMNGKTKFFELLRKFLGEDNCTSTELDTLLNSRFEPTYRLHKKLACQIGETNFSEMSKTSMLKKLSGGDLIGFEYKHKDAFQEKSYAKILISTNNLPATTDKTIGFYRRCLIIDFPNTFSEKRDVLEDIPEEEYNSLALKCCIILKDLLVERQFHNEGTIEDRIRKYEDYSDPLGNFIKEFTFEEANGFVWKWEFSKKLNQWCRENRHREISDVAIGKKMKEKEIRQELKSASFSVEGKRFRAWVGIKWKSEQEEQEEHAKHY